MGRGKGGRFAGFGAVTGGSFLAGFTGVGFLTESPRTKFIRNAPVAKVLYVFGLIPFYLFKKCMYSVYTRIFFAKLYFLKRLSYSLFAFLGPSINIFKI